MLFSLIRASVFERLQLCLLTSLPLELLIHSTSAFRSYLCFAHPISWLTPRQEEEMGPPKDYIDLRSPRGRARAGAWSRPGTWTAAWK